MSPLQTNVARMAGPNSPAGSTNSEQQRKLTTDKIISDCYSKVIIDGGRKVNDVSYITHIGVIEYSHYPSAPPPSNTNFGTVKHRILVLCKKNSGRMQLQKGSIKLIRISTKLGEHGIYRNYNILKSWTRRVDSTIKQSILLEM